MKKKYVGVTEKSPRKIQFFSSSSSSLFFVGSMTLTVSKSFQTIFDVFRFLMKIAIDGKFNQNSFLGWCQRNSWKKIWIVCVWFSSSFKKIFLFLFWSLQKFISNSFFHLKFPKSSFIQSFLKALLLKAPQKLFLNILPTKSSLIALSAGDTKINEINHDWKSELLWRRKSLRW